MTHRPTNHAASTGDTSADTSHAQGKEQSEKNTVGDWLPKREPVGQYVAFKYVDGVAVETGIGFVAQLDAEGEVVWVG
jgi:hypothetical protein